jgi:hypothetical protein
LRSEYRTEPPRIILYRQPIEAAFAALPAGRRLIARGAFDDVHIAHELFHHLESASRVRKLSREQSERAAHAFARELLDLPFDPGELTLSA